MAPVGVGVRKNGITKTKTSSSTTTTSTSSSSSSISCLQGRPHGLKKGPWTAAEDAILMEYVKKHGEGNWNAVQRNSGLMRCGKSCRLRWANHLRPNLKKGAFCSEEEERIVELHYKHGNKWARMAAQLPGRTDNEIKNYWNTRVKRCLRAGLPIYPRDASGGGGGKVNGYYHHHNHSQQLRENNIQAINNLGSSSSASALTSLLSAAPQPPLPSLLPPLVAGGLNPATSYRATTHLSLFDMFNPNSVSTTSGCSGGSGGCSYFPNPTCNNQPFGGGGGATTSGGDLALSLLSGSQPLPPASSSSSSLPNSLLLPSMPINCIQYNNSCMDFRGDLMMTTTMSPPDGGGVVELPSIQSFAPRATTTTTTTTPTSSDNNCSDNNYNMIATTSSTTDVDDHEEDFLIRGNSTGLLEDLIDRSSQALTRSEQSKEMMPPAVEIKNEDNYLWDYKVMDGLNLGQYNNNLIHDKHAQDSCCSMGAKQDHSRTPEESNPVVDDDFLSLLDNFPMSTVPAVPSVPDWCNGNDQTMAKNEEHHDFNPTSSTQNQNQNQIQNRSHEHEQEHNQELESSKNPTTTPITTEDHSFEIGVCCWKNLPGIY